MTDRTLGNVTGIEPGNVYTGMPAARMRSETHDALDVYLSDSRLQPLLGPGGPFEIAPITVDGVQLRSFVRAPTSIIEIFKMSRAHQSLTHLVFEDERLTFAEVRQKCLS